MAYSVQSACYILPGPDPTVPFCIQRNVAGVLKDNYSLGTDVYPLTPPTALELMYQYKARKPNLDTNISQAFFIHEEDGPTHQFGQTLSEIILATTTVEGQNQFYSDLDICHATKAHKLQETLGHIRDQRKHYQGKDCLTATDACAQRWGPCTHTYPVQVQANNTQDWHSISRHINFRTSWIIPDAKQSTLLKCVKTIVGTYARLDFVVRNIFEDNEFNCLHKNLLTFNPPVNFTGMAREWSLNWLMEKISGLTIVTPRHLMTGVHLDAQRHCRFQYGDFVLGHKEGGDN
eukprot:jgi/Psemu1/1834/gm1.1834_g